MVFISYKHKDKKFADKVRRRVKAAGLPSWMDEDILAGEAWKEAIDTAIRKSDVILVVVSPLSQVSPYVTYEWSFALGLKKLVIPVLLEHPKEIHPVLMRLQHLDFSDPRDQPWDKLIDLLLTFDLQEEIPKEIIQADDLIYDSRPDSYKHGFQTLGRHSHPAATRKLEIACESGDQRISGMAGIVLAQKSNFENGHALLGLSNALELQETRGEALTVLKDMNNSDAADIMMADFDRATDERRKFEIRDLQATAAEIKHPAILPLLIKMIQTEGSLQTVVIDAAAAFHDPSVLPVFQAAIDSGKFGGGSKSRIVKAVGTIGHPDGLGLLDQIQKSLPYVRYQDDTIVFQALLEAWDKIGGELVVKVYDEVYKDRRFEQYRDQIRKAAFELQNRLQSNG